MKSFDELLDDWAARNPDKVMKKKEQSLVDSVLEAGENGPVEPEDQFALPKQLNTITKLRKDGWSNARIFKAMELEEAEESSTKTSKPDIEGQGKNFIGPMKQKRGGLSKTVEQAKRTAKSSQLDAMFFQSYFGMPGSMPFKDVVELRNEYEEMVQEDPIVAENWLEYIGVASGGLFGTMAEGMKAGIPYAATGMAGAAMVGQMGPQAAFPEEALTVPLSGSVGMAVGSTVFWQQQGSGMMMRNMMERGVNPEVSAVLGSIGGLFYGLIEKLQVSKLIPKSMQKKANEIITKNIASTIGKWTKEYGEDWLVQIGQEELQLATELLTTELGAVLEGVETRTWESMVDEAWETAKQTGAGLLPMKGGQMAVDVAAEYGPTKIKDVVSGLLATNQELETTNIVEPEEALTVETTAQQINDDEANDFNIVYDREMESSVLLSEDEIIASGYDIDLNEIPETKKDEYGNKFYAVKIKGETDSEGNIRLTSASDRSTLLEETIEARLKTLQKSENEEDKALIAKIENWIGSVRKKASEMGLELRFTEEGEGNIELFSDAILYTLGGFKGLDKKFEDAIYIPEDISSEFIANFGKLSDGTEIFELLKGNEKGIQANQEFASAVDEEMLSQMEGAAETIRPPPKPPTKSKISKKDESGSYQLEPEVIEKAVALYPDVMALDKHGKPGPKAGRLNRLLGRLKTRKTKANPIQKDIPLEKMVGKPANKTARRIELKDGGVVWIGGEKTAEQWLEQVNSILSEEEQITASMWYEEAYPIFVENFGDDAIPYMVAWLMGNVNASPQQALSNLYLGAEQLRSELASQKSAGLPGAAKNVKKLLTGQSTTEGAGVKLYDFLDSALGKTTRTIMQDDPEGGGPVADDRHTNRDIGFVDSTLKNKLYELAKNPDDVKSIRIDQKATYKKQYDKETGKLLRNEDGTLKKKRSVPGPNETQYEWAVRKFNRISNELNESGYLGGDLKTYQHQAIGWTAIAKMLGTSDAMSIPESFRNQEPTLAYELKFGESTPYASKYGNAFKDMSLDEQVALTEKTVKEVIPGIAKDIGIKVKNINTGVLGGWKGDVSANATMSVQGSDQAIKGLADAIGYVFQQDAVGIVKLGNVYNGLGLAFSHDDIADKDIMERVYKILFEETDDKLAPGFFYDELTHPENDLNETPSIIVGSFIDQDQYADYEDRIEAATERVRNELNIELNFNVFGNKYEQQENNWQKNTKGESYRNSILEQFGKSFQERLDDYHGKKVDGILESAFARKADQQRKSRQLVPDFDYAAEVQAREDNRLLELSKRTKSAWIRKRLFDKLDPVLTWQKDVEDQFLGGNRIRNHHDVALAAEMYIGKVSEKLKDFNKAIIDIDNKDSFVSRLTNELGISLEEFSQYLHALHAKERNEAMGEDGLSGMTNQAARNLKADLNAKYGLKELKKFVKEFQRDVIDAGLKLRLDTGLLDQESYDFFMDKKENYSNYIPLFRVFENDEAVIDESKKGPMAFNVKGKEFRRARGSKRAVKNPFISALEQHHEAVIRSEKNLVNKRLLALVEAYPSESYEVKGIPHRPVYDQDGEIDYYVPIEGRDSNGEPIKDKNVINVKVDGKVKQIIFKGEDGHRIAQAMLDMGRTKGVRALYQFNNYLRYVNTIANPEFMVTNFVRDIQTAGINISAEQGNQVMVQALSPNNLKNAWKATYQVVQNDDTSSEWGQLYERLRKAGGKTGFFDYERLEDKIQSLEKDLKRVEKSGRGIKQAGKSIFNFVENVNEATETAVRLTLFKAMLDQGYSEEEAASGAKNVTINFNRKGEWGQVLNSLYLFANAGLQGSYRIFGVVKNSRKAQAAVSTLAGLGVMEAILNNMASEDDDEYDKLGNWEKDNNFIIRYGEGDKFFKLRLPYGYNMFKVVGNIAGDIAWRQMNGEAVEMDKQMLRFLEAFNSAFNPIGGGDLSQTLSPTATDWMVQLSSNKAFHGGPLKPEQVYGPRKAEIENAWERTPDVYKDMTQWWFTATGGHIRYNEDGSIAHAVRGPLGGMGDWSPETVEFWVDYLGGGLGKSVMRSISTAKGIVNHDSDYTKAPFVRQFYGKFDQKSEARILYAFEKDMKRTLYTEKESLKYFNYLDDFYYKGNLTKHERDLRYQRFIKAQNEVIMSMQ